MDREEHHLLGTICHAAGDGTERCAAMSEWEELTALAEESRTLSAVLLDLDAEQFQRPTNCPPWDLIEFRGLG